MELYAYHHVISQRGEYSMRFGSRSTWTLSLAISICASTAALAGFSFTSTKYLNRMTPQAKPVWKNYSGAQLYSSDNDTTSLKVFGCTFDLLETPTGNNPVDVVVRLLKAKREGRQVGSTTTQGVFELVHGRTYEMGAYRPTALFCSSITKGTVLYFIIMSNGNLPAALIIKQGESQYLSHSGMMYTLTMKKDYFTPKFKQDTVDKAGSLLFTLLETWAKAIR
jgi:hypothetical protein